MNIGKNKSCLTIAAFFALAVTGAQAQLVPAYQFAQFNGFFGEIGGGTLHTAQPADDVVFSAIPIGFNFVYDGITYTQISICTNGWVRFGGNTVGTEYSPMASISNQTTNSISVFARNLNARNTAPTGALRSETLGDAGSRTFVVQWKDFQSTGLGNAARMNVQLVLVEGTNQIAIVYGTCTQTAVDGTCQVGLKGSSLASVRSVAVASSWSTPTIGNSSNATCIVDNALAGQPTNGLTYLFTPPITPVFSVGNAFITEGNSGTSTMNVPVNIAGPTAGTMTLQYSTVNGTAQASAGDFVGASNATLTVPGNTTLAFIPIQIIGDPLPEEDEIFNVAIANPGSGSIGVSSNQQTIEDDDFTCGTAQAFAGATGTTPPAGWTNVDLAGGEPALWQFGTPTSCNPGKIRPFQSPIVAPFAIYDSDACGVDPGGEDTALVTPSAAFGDVLTATLSWDEIYKGYTQVAALVEVSTNGGGSWTTLLTQTGADSGDPVGGVSVRRTLDVADAIRNQSNVRFRFRFVGDFGFWWIVDNVQVCTGELPSGTSQISVADGSGAELNTSQTGFVSIPVTLNPSNAGSVSVGYTITNDTAISGVDFSGPLTGTVTFAPTQTSRQILVPTIGNDVRAAAKSFNVTLNTPITGSAFLGQFQARGTILNDDPIPAGFVFGIDNRVPSTGATTNAKFELDPANASATLVKWPAAMGSEYAGGDFAGTDFTKFYAIDISSTPKLVVIDALTLEETVVGTMIPDANEKFRGLSWDRTTGSFWALSTTTPSTPGAAGTLYRVNKTTAAYASKVDFSVATGALYSGLFVRHDGAFFTVDTNSDRLFRISRATGGPTVVQFTLGVDLLDDQIGGDFDDQTNQLYIAARDQVAPFTNRLYRVDSGGGNATTLQNLSITPYFLGHVTAMGVAREFTSGETAAVGWELYE